MPIIKLAEKYRSAYPCAVVGVDVAAGEVGDDPTAHAEAFEKAKELGLKVTVHAGEAREGTGLWKFVFTESLSKSIPG